MTALIISNVVLWVVALLQLVLILAVIRRLSASAAAPSSGLRPGTKAPYFSAPTLVAGRLSLSDFAGKTLALVFVGPECEPCRQVVPEIVRLSEGVPGSRSEFVLVSNGTREQTARFVEEVGWKRPTLVATRGETSLFDDYGVTGTPAYCIVNGKGAVQSSGYPGADDPQWQTLIAGGEERARSSNGGVGSISSGRSERSEARV